MLFPLVCALLCMIGACNDSDVLTQGTDPRVESLGRYKVVWLKGTPYEMGYQHGTLLHDQMKEAVDYINGNLLLALMVEKARAIGILDLAYANSYPEVLEECRGLVDATADLGFTMDQCILLNFGDVLIEFLQDSMPGLAAKIMPACAGIAVSGAATTDGRLYHGRILDWDNIEYVLNNPVIFVRQPTGGITHAVIGFPGNVSPYQGMNVEGLSISSNEAHPRNGLFQSLSGRSHVQLLGRILAGAHNLAEAEQMIWATDHMSAEIFTIANGRNNMAAVFEMTATAIGARRLDAKGLVYVTNHFLAPETAGADEEPAGFSTLLRYARLQQLLEPEGVSTLYGSLDPAGLIRVMRDRMDPETGTEVPEDTFDNGRSLATSACLYEIVFDPANLVFWVAAGRIPVPQQPFQGFSLGELAGLTNAMLVEPGVYP